MTTFHRWQPIHCPRIVRVSSGTDRRVRIALRDTRDKGTDEVASYIVNFAGRDEKAFSKMIGELNHPVFQALRTLLIEFSGGEFTDNPVFCPQTDGTLPVSNTVGSNMTRAFTALAFVCFSFLSAWAQSPGSQSCSAGFQFEPVLVNNPEARVTFACRDATPLQVIESTGRQTRIPIGIVLGEDPAILSKAKRTYRVSSTDVKSALAEAVAATGYTVTRSGQGYAIIAGDLTPRQRQVLTHKLADFPGATNATMSLLATQLTMWIQVEFDHAAGFGGSILRSINDEKVTLGAVPPSTVQQIADQIVSLGSKGLWILKTDPFQRTGEWTDSVEIEPYQHYSNLSTSDD